jgi:hypothetical protein
VYEYLIRGEVPADGDPPHEAVSHHQGSCQDFLNRHHQDVSKALQNGLRGVREIAPHLFGRIADARTLKLAWDFLASKGGQAPGPNGHRYGDYTSAEVWELCRCLADAIRKGVYRPGPERVIWVKKTSGNGNRPLVLLSVEDRTVQRSVVLILQPVLNRLFDDRSFGYRPRLGHLDALALAEHLTLSERRRIWLTEDVKDAFLHIPLRRLLQTVEKVLPDSELLNLLELLLPGRELPGLRQGGSLSPLMLNWYLHWFLDRPWRRDCPQTPLIRVADDLLALCRSKKQALEARMHLDRLLIPAGMPLKGTPDMAIRDLAAGGTAGWLGFAVRQAKRVLAVGIGDRSWDKLEEGLVLTHTKEDGPLRAFYLVGQWLSNRGPCYAWSDRQQVCQGIIALAQEYAFEEVPTASELLQLWQRAYARWCKLRKQVRAAYRLTGATR